MGEPMDVETTARRQDPVALGGANAPIPRSGSGSASSIHGRRLRAISAGGSRADRTVHCMSAHVLPCFRIDPPSLPESTSDPHLSRPLSSDAATSVQRDSTPDAEENEAIRVCLMSDSD